ESSMSPDCWWPARRNPPTRRSSTNTSTRPVRALLPPTRRPLSSVMISNPARPANQQRGKSRGTYEADDSNSFVGILRSCLGAEPGCDPGHADDNEVGAAEKSVGLRRGVGGFAAYCIETCPIPASQGCAG